MNYHIGSLVLSSLCVGAFVTAGIWWCSFCRLQPAKRTPPNTKLVKLVFHSSTITMMHGPINISTNSFRISETKHVARQTGCDLVWCKTRQKQRQKNVTSRHCLAPKDVTGEGISAANISESLEGINQSAKTHTSPQLTVLGRTNIAR